MSLPEPLPVSVDGEVVTRLVKRATELVEAGLGTLDHGTMRVAASEPVADDLELVAARIVANARDRARRDALRISEDLRLDAREAGERIRAKARHDADEIRANARQAAETEAAMLLDDARATARRLIEEARHAAGTIEARQRSGKSFSSLWVEAEGRPETETSTWFFEDSGT